MAAVATAFSLAFRDYTVDGVPSSGDFEPIKSGIRALGATIEGYVADNGVIASGSNLSAGDDALLGNAGTFNTAFGRRAGQGSTGSFNAYFGEAAGFGASGGNNVYVGPTAGEGAFGDRNVYVGPISMRYRIGSSGIGIGYAAGENVDGDNHTFIHDHAGAPPYTERPLTSPSMDPGTNILTTQPPTYYGGAVTGLTIGKTYRLQFENGGGTAPLPLASVSTLATLQSTGATWTWLITSYDVTTAGSGAYVVGLCWYHWDAIQVFGSGSPDGPNQSWLGFDNTREFLPQNDGLTSLGRSPIEAVTWGKRGAYRVRGVTARYLGSWSNAGEAAAFDFGINGIQRIKLVVDAATGNMQVVAYDATGTATSTPLELDNARGIVKPRVIVNAANDAAAAAAGAVVGEIYRNGSVLMIRVV